MRLPHALAIVLLCARAGPAAVPDDVGRYLGRIAGFSAASMAALEAGQAIVQTVADKRGQLLVVGAMRIRTTKEHVRLYFDEYVKYEDGVSILQVGRFSTTPVLADVARLSLEDGDIDALRDCSPGDCDLRVGSAITEIKAAVDWRAPDYRARVNAFVRQRLVDYVAAYHERGDAALVTYFDGSKPVSLAERWRTLLAAAPALYGYAPQLYRYLTEYPRAELPGGSDFIRWAKVDQGLKPVVTVAHVVAYADPAQPDRLTLALKQIYASRYAEASFSLVTIVDAGSLDGRPVCYVVLVSRTLTEMLRGALGGVKRTIANGEVAKGTETTLRQMQEGLEKAAGVR